MLIKSPTAQDRQNSPRPAIRKSIILDQRFLGMFPPGIEPGTFRVLGGRDNHYTTET